MSESHSTSNSVKQDASLDQEVTIEQWSRELLDLCEDFCQFSQECAFLFDAFAAVAREPECITPDTSEGIRHVNFWLKYQVIGYREKINRLHEGWRILKCKL
ncbi:hypothetical protein [Thalassomonas actiniarum]|uniref:Uncharacterized protein n=1 Tax=Thalassomonas actiniarum TaxID=485447 RepID=A0AAF0C1F3_9GAMM|nr:hypothetical protein [Thalassomonas actiniarum]WDD96715.1 hypothetical protein SG35_015150 [Thalassomonas actiniarum]